MESGLFKPILQDVISRSHDKIYDDGSSILCRVTSRRVIGEQLISSLRVRDGTNHPSRRRRIKFPQLSDFFSRRFLLMTSCNIGLNPPDLTNSSLRTWLLWFSINSPPRPLEERGRRRFYSVFLSNMRMHARRVTWNLHHVIQEMDRCAALVGTLLMTSCKIGLNRPDLITSPLRTQPLWVSNNSPPGPLSWKRGGGRGFIECINNT